ncbi:hypothetical protein [Pedobacter duraquae]|uniref:Uncharacterized protein n=1 Tax=Pedobacter duraquae TaxID=425511 RepID=A0A4R6INJ3_9SPHI|nr:hypothetical protein [Pedobacter duraquae]TDO23802.1 hypothetical protein CLV32_0087 [Pedobacter duraquae]
MEIHFTIIGIVLIPLSIVHVIFPRYFDWGRELKSLSLINRQMIYVHTFFVALMVLLIGILCLTSARELIHTDLGKKICLGLGIFWTLRLIIQFFGYSSLLWKGKAFETTVHISFALLWAYMSIVFLMAYAY